MRATHQRLRLLRAVNAARSSLSLRRGEFWRGLHHWRSQLCADTTKTPLSNA